MTHTGKGFIAEDLEESVAAPGCGDCVDGVTLSIIGVTVDAAVAVAVIYYNPPSWPPQDLKS